METRRLHLNGRGWKTQTGQLGTWLPAPTLMLFHIVGFGEAAFAQPIIDTFEGLRAAGKPVHLFADLERLEKYDSLLRIHATDYFRLHRSSLGSLHVLVRSRLVAMGVAVANLALSGLITSHADREPFKRALDAQLTAHQVVGFSSDVLAA